MRIGAKPKAPDVATISSSGDQAALMALASRLHSEARRERRLLRRLIRCASTTIQGVLGCAFVSSFDERSGDFRLFIFDPKSALISWWDDALILGVIYSTAYAPLAVVFPQSRWSGHVAVDVLLDSLFCLDMIVRFRTAFRDHGYDVTDAAAIAKHYLRSWFLVDLLSSLPIDRLISALLTRSVPVLGTPDGRIGYISLVDLFSLLRIMRIGRLVRKLSSITGANFLRVVYLMYLFVLFGHWLGLMWYSIAIRPIESTSEFDNLAPWLWTIDGNEPYFVALRYVCSLYWALSVMTNLKGLPAHETRQCLWYEPNTDFVTDPLAERVYTILVFIFGSLFYSCIYGNINQFVTNLYASGMRYRKRMEELQEFARFHRLSPQLRNKIRNYVDFQWSVTKGINVDTIAAGLPAHLQMEMRLQLNKRLVEQVSIFAGCPRGFFEALVSKLQPCICVAGDFVFYEGELGSRMYFIKRGVAQVGKGDQICATFKEGDYFGEVALLTDQPRTASVIAVSDLMLLSLSCTDLEAVLTLFPAARSRIEAAADERLKALAKTDRDAASKVSSKSYLLDVAGTHRRGSWGYVGSLLGTRAGHSHSRSNSLSTTSKNTSASSMVTSGLYARRLSQQAQQAKDGKIACAPATERLTEAEGQSSPERSPRREDRRKSLDSLPMQALASSTANEVRSMTLTEPRNISARSTPKQSRRVLTTTDPDKQDARRGDSDPKPRRRLRFGATRKQQKIAPGLGSTDQDEPDTCPGSPQPSTLIYSVKKNGASPSSVKAPLHGSANGSRRPSAANWARRCSTSPTSKDTDEASAASAVGRRRRSVDCGLDFEQHAHAPLVIPKQWERCLGSSGGSAGRRSSHVAALRLSLDGGLSTAEPASSYAITRCGVSAPGSRYGSPFAARPAKTAGEAHIAVVDKPSLGDAVQESMDVSEDNSVAGGFSSTLLGGDSQDHSHSSTTSSVSGSIDRMRQGASNGSRQKGANAATRERGQQPAAGLLTLFRRNSMRERRASQRHATVDGFGAAHTEASLHKSLRDAISPLQKQLQDLKREQQCSMDALNNGLQDLQYSFKEMNAQLRSKLWM